MKVQNLRWSLAFYSFAIVGILGILFSLYFFNSKIEHNKKTELLFHVQRLAGSVRAQVFERFADSQAFATNDDMREALLGSETDRRRASQTLQVLIGLYDVYRASFVTNLSGKIVAAGFRDEQEGQLFQQTPGIFEQSFDFQDLERWKNRHRSSNTQMSDFFQTAELKKVFDTPVLQTFSSPVYSKANQVIGFVVNVADRTYIDRIFSDALSEYKQTGLSQVTLALLDARGDVVIHSGEGPGNEVFRELTARDPSFSGGVVLSRNGLLISKESLRDVRLEGLPTMTIAFQLSEAEFLSGVRWVKIASNIVVVLLLLVICSAAFFFARLRTMSVQLVAKTMIEAQESERARLARELHDELGQALTSIKFHLSGLSDGSGDLQKEKLHQARRMIEETNDLLRRISLDLHPSLIENLGFYEALRWKMASISQYGEFRTRFVLTSLAEKVVLSLDTQRHLYRIFQEALNNSVKHSGGHFFIVCIFTRGHDLILRLSDNGQGISENRLANGHLGLIGMKERALLTGGRIVFQARKRAGTIVQVTIPLIKGAENS